MQAYEFVEVARLADDRGTMDTRGLTDICDVNDGKPVERVGRPPYHYNCKCDTVIAIREKGASDGDESLRG